MRVLVLVGGGGWWPSSYKNNLSSGPSYIHREVFVVSKSLTGWFYYIHLASFDIKQISVIVHLDQISLKPAGKHAVMLDQRMPHMNKS